MPHTQRLVQSVGSQRGSAPMVRLLRIAATTSLCLAPALLNPWTAPLAAETFLVGPTRTYTQINQVAGLLDPGDLVLVDGDNTYAPALLDRNGSEALPITIRGVRVNGNRPVLSGGVNTIEVQSNWTVVEGFEFTGGSHPLLLPPRPRRHAARLGSARLPGARDPRRRHRLGLVHHGVRRGPSLRRRHRSARRLHGDRRGGTTRAPSSACSTAGSTTRTAATR